MDMDAMMEHDPDGTTQQVAVIMTGQVYRDAGLKHSKYPRVEGLLYDKLCQIGKHKLRDDVRKMAIHIAMGVNDKEFKPTVEWLDNFMRRFCLSKKKMGFHSSAMLKRKDTVVKAPVQPPPQEVSDGDSGLTQEDVFNVLGLNLGGTNDVGNGVTEEDSSVASLQVNNDILEEVLAETAKDSEVNGDKGPLETVDNEDTPVKDNGVDKNDCSMEDLFASDTENTESTSLLKDKINDVCEEVKTLEVLENLTKEINSREDDKNKDNAGKEEKAGKEGKSKEKAGKEDKSKEKSGKEDTSKENAGKEDKSKENAGKEDKSKEKAGKEDKSKEKAGKEDKSKEKAGKEDEQKENLGEEDDQNEDDGKQDVLENETESMEVDEEQQQDSSNDSENRDEESSKENTESENESDKEDMDEKRDKAADAGGKMSRQMEDELGIKYSKKENKYLKENQAVLQKKLKESVMRCSACNEQINHQLRSMVHTHPRLGILFCKRCRKYYGKGRYCKDEEGYDEYCRLCAEGGDLLCCEQEDCFNGFCKRCIKRTMGRSELKNAETTDNWACYICDNKPMMELRALHRVILKNLKSSKAEDENLNRRDLHKKEMTNKFESLKRSRSEKLQKSSPVKVEKKDKETVNPPLIKKKDWSQFFLNMTHLMTKCLENVQKVEKSWKSSQCTQEATLKAGQRLKKQITGMKNYLGEFQIDVEKGIDALEEPSTNKKSSANVDEDVDDSKSQKKQKGNAKESKSRKTRAEVESDGQSEDKDENKKTSKRRAEVESDGQSEDKDENKKTSKRRAEVESDGQSEDKDENKKTSKRREVENGADLSSNEDNSIHQDDPMEQVDDSVDEGTLAETKKNNPESEDNDEAKNEKVKDIEKEKEKETENMKESENEKESEKDKESENVKEDKDNESGPKTIRVRSMKFLKNTDDEDDTNEKEEVKKNEKIDKDDESETKNRRSRRRKSSDKESDEDKKKKGEKEESTRRRSSRSGTTLPVEYEESDEEKKRGKGKSKKRNEKADEESDEEESAKKRGRGRSKKRNEKADEESDEEESSKKRGSSRSKKKQEKAEESDEESSKKHGRGKKKQEKGEESNEEESSKKRGRGKKKQEKGDEESDEEESSKKRGKGKKTQEKGDEESDEEESLKKRGRNKKGHEDMSEEEKSKKAKDKKEKGDKAMSEDDEEKRKSKKAKSKKGKDTDEEKNKKGTSDEASDTETKKKGKGRNKEKESEAESRKKRKRRGSKDSEEEKKEKKKRSKRKKNDDDDDLLGIASETSNKETSEEEDTDTEIRRRRAEYEDHSEKKKKKKIKEKAVKKEEESQGEEDAVKKEEPESEEDKKAERKVKKEGSKSQAKVKVKEENVSGMEELDEEKENSKSKDAKKSGKSPKKKTDESKRKENKENRDAFSQLLAASDEDNNKSDDGDGIENGAVSAAESSASDSAKKETEKKRKKKKNSDEEEKEGSDSKEKKTKKDRKKKTDNQKAKASILVDSGSEDDDKPKPMCKKKNYLKKCAKQRERFQHLTEEEIEELKNQQLEGPTNINVERINSNIVDKVNDDGFIDVTDHPELLKRHGRKSENYEGDADEEDSEEEFEKLMKFNVNKKFTKPGPKSKKKVFEAEEKEKEEGEEEGEEEDNDEEKGNDKDKKEKKGKKEGKGKKKKEGLLDISIDKEDEDDDDEDDAENDGKKKRKDGGISLNEKMKKQILMSSDEEGEDSDSEEQFEETPEQEEKRRLKYEEKKKKRKEQEEKEREDDDSDPDEPEPKVHKKGWMSLNLSSDDGEVGEKDEDLKLDSEDEEDNDDDEEEEEEEEDDEDDSDFEESPRKRRAFQISSSDSEDGKKKKKKKKKDSSSSAESESEEDKKPKRKRIKKMTSSSDDGDEEEGNKNDSPTKHKKIRKVISDEDLVESTKNATQEEETRRKRIAERQKKYNAIFEIDVESDQKELGKLVLDFDPETKKELVSVHEKLVKHLKPHQFKGIKFMWDATCESIEMVNSKPGSGCVLAHCMGLGKTLQVITFTHTLLTCKKVNRTIQRVMVCCPVNTVYNWVSEYSNWLKGKMMPFDVMELVSAKDLWSRAYRLDDWWKEGGVIVVGYDMYRNLANTKNKRYKGKMKDIFQKTLVNPGPDLIVCDEGHILKNEKTALSIAINKINTLRRIILTGTPLQNNLKEYHCMIQFVKPNLLGTKKEFMNRFVNPIEQGQCVEAQPRDVRRMKRRAHILHNMLDGCVQRFDYTVLKPFLPPKFEYVISVQLSEIQIKLYQYYLDNLAQGGPKRQGSGLFVDFGALSRVWTHPKVLELAVRKALFEDNDEEEMADFICDDTTTEDSSDDDRKKKKKKQPQKKKKNDDDDDIIEEEEVGKEELGVPGAIPGLTEDGKVRVDWWKKVISDNAGEDYEEGDFLDNLEHSGKLILLLDILRECSSIGDKVLVFSQSLLALDMMEDFLELVDRGEVDLPAPEDPLPLPFKHWKKDRDYLRLDGSTSADARKNLCKLFNSPTNERCRLFLISTRAGGLGINLVAANRVVIFDSSWNPSHDTQSIFRVYRFGQKKPCYIYRFVSQGTMEEKIYSRQIAKMSTALRVVDEHQIKRYFKMDELAQLYEFTPSDVDKRETPTVPDDCLLAELLRRQKDWIVSYLEHDSLLENQTSEELTEEERKAAWEDYENEKKGLIYQQQYQRNAVMPVVGPNNMMAAAGGSYPSLSPTSFSFEGVVNTIKAQSPNLTQAELCESVLLATKQIQKIHLAQYQRIQGMVYNLQNPMIAPEQRKLLPFGNHPEMVPMLEQQKKVLEDNINRENQVINHMGQLSSPRMSNNMASLMAAGLMRGQPAPTGLNSATANYVARSTSTPSTSGTKPTEKPTSKDVIMLD